MTPSLSAPSPRATPSDRGNARRADDLEPRIGETVLHGHRVTYRTAGEGPVVLLIHGITGDSRQWNDVIPQLADRYTVLAPDLLGHGQSAKPRGDYSLGAYAASLRDLLIVLGHRRATVVGHSLGGGIAMQFSYEYPVFCERLVLVDSGGLGPEVHLLLRAATLPGSELVLPSSPTHASTRWARRSDRRSAAWTGARPRPGRDDARVCLVERRRGAPCLPAHAAGGHRPRRAARERHRPPLPGPGAPHADHLGRRDPLIPVEHADVAHRGIPGSRLAIFDDTGHFPHIEEPVRFARVLIDFMESTNPAEFDFSDQDLDLLRQRMLDRARRSP